MSGADIVLRRALLWRLERGDGLVQGFTEYDADIVHEGLTYAAASGFDPAAIEARLGLAVDNSEVVAALSGPALAEADVAAGRLDGARVRLIALDWDAPDGAEVLFEGSLGEIRRKDGVFEADLRGLTEALSRPAGRVFGRRCGAVLGDAACRVDLSAPGLHWQTEIAALPRPGHLRLGTGAGFAPGWFAGGRLEVLSGAARGLAAALREDRAEPAGRLVALWEEIGAPLAPGDAVRLLAGCDKRAETCRAKFDNFLNFRGFPHMPGDDWLIAPPAGGQVHDGARMER
ncbi:MAG: DUF2163 domain-containing protein [Rhodobacteraceae bacterium]|nr:DUF2163 domain-containing protein [Paracoccaceae bacterium]